MISLLPDLGQIEIVVETGLTNGRTNDGHAIAACCRT